MKKILLVFGTRPEAIKMCPLIYELQDKKIFQLVLCVTGQHREMLNQVLDTFAIKPDYDLKIMRENQGLSEITIQVLKNIRPVLDIEQPDILLVHGDTTTTFAAALAAFYMHIPVGHVEAGLRTYRTDAPFPEEFNRQTVGILATYHFAPTDAARQNLLREGKDGSKIYVTGNTAIDALKWTIDPDYQNEHLQWAADSRLILLTVHRRENLGRPLEQIFLAVRRVVDECSDLKVIYPIHRNPKIRKIAVQIFENHQRIRLLDPLDVTDFHNFMAHAYLILTDSGGIQEEAAFLGRPVLVLRDTTERGEGVAAGILRLAGTGEDSVYREFKRLLLDRDTYKKMSQSSNPYGDGTAGKRIADILEQILQDSSPS